MGGRAYRQTLSNKTCHFTLAATYSQLPSPTARHGAQSPIFRRYYKDLEFGPIGPTPVLLVCTSTYMTTKLSA